MTKPSLMAILSDLDGIRAKILADINIDIKQYQISKLSDLQNYISAIVSKEDIDSISAAGVPGKAFIYKQFSETPFAHKMNLLRQKVLTLKDLLSDHVNVMLDIRDVVFNGFEEMLRGFLLEGIVCYPSEYPINFIHMHGGGEVSTFSIMNSVSSKRKILAKQNMHSDFVKQLSPMTQYFSQCLTRCDDLDELRECVNFIISYTNTLPAYTLPKALPKQPFVIQKSKLSVELKESVIKKIAPPKEIAHPSKIWDLASVLSHSPNFVKLNLVILYEHFKDDLCAIEDIRFAIPSVIIKVWAEADSAKMGIYRICQILNMIYEEGFEEECAETIAWVLSRSFEFVDKGKTTKLLVLEDLLYNMGFFTKAVQMPLKHFAEMISPGNDNVTKSAEVSLVQKHILANKELCRAIAKNCTIENLFYMANLRSGSVGIADHLDDFEFCAIVLERLSERPDRLKEIADLPSYLLYAFEINKFLAVECAIKAEKMHVFLHLCIIDPKDPNCCNEISIHDYIFSGEDEESVGLRKIIGAGIGVQVFMDDESTTSTASSVELLKMDSSGNEVPAAVGADDSGVAEEGAMGVLTFPRSRFDDEEVWM